MPGEYPVTEYQVKARVQPSPTESSRWSAVWWVLKLGFETSAMSMAKIKDETQATMKMLGIVRHSTSVLRRTVLRKLERGSLLSRIVASNFGKAPNASTHTPKHTEIPIPGTNSSVNEREKLEQRSFLSAIAGSLFGNTLNESTPMSMHTETTNGGVQTGMEPTPQHSGGQATSQILDNSFNPTEETERFEHSEVGSEEVGAVIPKNHVPEHAKCEFLQIDGGIQSIEHSQTGDVYMDTEPGPQQSDGQAMAQNLDDIFNPTEENERFEHSKVEKSEEVDRIVPQNGVPEQAKSRLLRIDEGMYGYISRFQVLIEDVFRIQIAWWPLPAPRREIAYVAGLEQIWWKCRSIKWVHTTTTAADQNQNMPSGPNNTAPTRKSRLFSRSPIKFAFGNRLRPLYC
ncbi:hypothetical protein K440DRAFT_636210 [Wilcoxina mikolae CBS 423.85]|nr:hypothetical protein K440DRAFT_636210 [Wilcoxina mikolae CBS 423.85]